jgi:hypothetical protein
MLLPFEQRHLELELAVEMVFDDVLWFAIRRPQLRLRVENRLSRR